MIVVVLDEYADGFDPCDCSFLGQQALARRLQARRLLSGVRLTKLLGQQSFGGIDVANA